MFSLPSAPHLCACSPSPVACQTTMSVCSTTARALSSSRPPWAPLTTSEPPWYWTLPFLVLRTRAAGAPSALILSAMLRRHDFSSKRSARVGLELPRVPNRPMAAATAHRKQLPSGGTGRTPPSTARTAFHALVLWSLTWIPPPPRMVGSSAAFERRPRVGEACLRPRRASSRCRACAMTRHRRWPPLKRAFARSLRPRVILRSHVRRPPSLARRAACGKSGRACPKASARTKSTDLGSPRFPVRGLRRADEFWPS